MIKKLLIWIACFVVVFAAGVSAGLLFDYLKQRPSHRSWLTSQLNLTTEQREQMSKIWSDAMQPLGSRGEDRRNLQQQRDKAIMELLTDEQEKEYESILQDYARNLEELAQRRRDAFKQAVEKTKEILTPEQSVKYEEIIQRRRESGSERPRSSWHGRYHSRRTLPETEETSTTTTPSDS